MLCACWCLCGRKWCFCWWSTWLWLALYCVWWSRHAAPWRHQMEIFSALLVLCAGIHRSPVNSPHKGQWRGASMFSYLCLNKRSSKQPWGWWLETPSCSLLRYCNESSLIPHPKTAWHHFSDDTALTHSPDPPGQNDSHFANDIFRILVNEKKHFD